MYVEYLISFPPSETGMTPTDDTLEDAINIQQDTICNFAVHNYDTI